MLTVINTLPQIKECFGDGGFDLALWRRYIDRCVPGAAQLCLEDMEECTRDGRFTYEQHFLPVLNAVRDNPRMGELEENFFAVTDRLEERITKLFGRAPEVDIVLYLGLCGGAGWVTEVDGRMCVLLGIEKILELGWHTSDMMRGLVWHELGHVYHASFGNLDQPTASLRQEFIWQLFCEGIAMYFEQVIACCDEYFHQDIDGWLDWCKAHHDELKADFDRDLDSMIRTTQRYFGDWASYCGRGDTGYYLGNCFVRWALREHTFDRLIAFSVDDAERLYARFIAEE